MTILKEASNCTRRYRDLCVEQRLTQHSFLKRKSDKYLAWLPLEERERDYVCQSLVNTFDCVWRKFSRDLMSASRLGKLSLLFDSTPILGLKGVLIFLFLQNFLQKIANLLKTCTSSSLSWNMVSGLCSKVSLTYLKQVPYYCRYLNTACRYPTTTGAWIPHTCCCAVPSCPEVQPRFIFFQW